jgi:hypothetical protein
MLSTERQRYERLMAPDASGWATRSTSRAATAPGSRSSKRLWRHDFTSAADYVHAVLPSQLAGRAERGTRREFVGAGDGPCAIVMIGAVAARLRDESRS